MADNPLKYSIEQLIHFTCRCGYTWTHSGALPDWLIVCPKCNAVAFELEQVPLIEAFDSEELFKELDKRGYFSTLAISKLLTEMIDA